MVLSAEIVQGKGGEHFASFSCTILWEHFFKNQWDDENCQYFIFFTYAVSSISKNFVISCN